MVVFEDADLGRAVDAAAFGVFSLNGERCTAGSRVLVHERPYERCCLAVAERAGRVVVGDPRDGATEAGPLIHPDHLARVENHLAIGAAEGARLLAGGARPAGMAVGNYL